MTLPKFGLVPKNSIRKPNTDILIIISYYHIFQQSNNNVYLWTIYLISFSFSNWSCSLRCRCRRCSAKAYAFLATMERDLVVCWLLILLGFCFHFTFNFFILWEGGATIHHPTKCPTSYLFKIERVRSFVCQCAMVRFSTLTTCHSKPFSKNISYSSQ